MHPNKPKIFISHAWEDKPLVRRLEAELQAAGADVWVDHAAIRGGDNLPERISDALEWCNTLLLIWSEAASQSRWVKLEWTNAISLAKAIIPCQVGETNLPAILAHKAYVDFRNIYHGITQLLQALNLARQKTTPTPTSPTAQVARVIHSQFTGNAVPAKPKPPQVVLRTKPLDNFSGDDVLKMLKEKDFYDSNRNVSGKGLRHEYETLEQKGKMVVIDRATGLMWQQSCSPNSMNYPSAKEYIRSLNHQQFAGHNDWHLPTLEEAMSLMEPKQYVGLHLDPVFGHKQPWIWTADKVSAHSSWVVYFHCGYCYHDMVGHYYYGRCVHAVR